MFHLSESDRIKAKADALRTLTIHANEVLADRLSTREKKEGAVLALMSIEWTPGLARAVGSTPINKLLQRFRNDPIFSSDEYLIFKDMLLHATDDTIPIFATNWRIWHELIIRFHLFEIADVLEWVALVARFDSKGIRTPRCLARMPFGELSRVDWGCSSPVTIFLTWQAARQDYGGVPVTAVGQEPPSLRGFQNLTDSIQTESIADTTALMHYREARLSHGLPPDYESLCRQKDGAPTHFRRG